MRILVLGATGTTGTHFVGDALRDGHEVVAYVRSPEKMTARPGLTIVGGDVHDVPALTGAMRGADAVVSMLGLSSPSPNGFSAQSLRTIVEAARAGDTSRVLVMSAFGVGESLPKASFLARLMYRTGARAIYADKARGEQLLTTSDLDWTLAYPVLLTNDPPSARFQAIDLNNLVRLPGLPRVSRADVAAFLLVAAQDPRWSRRTAVLTTGGHPVLAQTAAA